MVNLKGLKLLNPELTGFWTPKPRSHIEKSLLRIYHISTFLILIIIFFQIITHLALVSVVAFLISAITIVILEIYTSRYVTLTFPVSQGIIFVLLGYIQFYVLLLETSGLGAPSIPLIPGLPQIFIGIGATLRILTGIGIVRSSNHYKDAYIPYSMYPQKSLETFESNLRITSTDMPQEFYNEPPSAGITPLILMSILSLFLIIILLTPMWLSLFFGLMIYPYILLIPGVIFTFIFIMHLSRKN